MGEAKRRSMVELPVRLMLRAEGEWWRAYFGAGVGHPEDPDGPVLLGQIRMNLAENPAIKEAFIALMSDALKIEVARATGASTVSVERRQAPESERAGNA